MSPTQTSDNQCMIQGQTVTVQTGGPPVYQHTTVQTQPAVNVVTVPPPTDPNVRERYATKTSLVLGVLQCIIAAIAFILEIIGISIRVAVHITGVGIWCGIIFGITGALGILASKSKHVCTIVAFMVMGIVSAVLSILALLVIYSISAGIDTSRNGYHFLYEYPYQGEYLYRNRGGQMAVGYMMIILALMECVMAIVSSAIACAGTCCAPSTAVRGTVIGHQYMGQQQVVLQTAGQQQVMYQMQPGQVMYTAQPHGQFIAQPGYHDPRMAMAQTVVPSAYPAAQAPPMGQQPPSYPAGGQQPPSYQPAQPVNAAAGVSNLPPDVPHKM